MFPSPFRRLFDAAILDAKSHGMGKWAFLRDEPNPYTHDGYVGAMQDLLSEYHAGATNALDLCNAHDSESENAPRVLLAQLWTYCWDQRVPFPKALTISSLYLRKCRQWLPSETAENAQ
jgi:hypothetical protein